MLIHRTFVMRTYPFHMLLGSVLVALLVSGCGSTAFNVTVAGTENQNRCEDQNRGFPADVVIVELLSEVSFLQVERQEFWENPNALGGDELKRQEERLTPGEPWEIAKLKPGKETRYIGVAANLTCPDGESWRTVRSVEELRKRWLQVEIQEDRVNVSVRR